MHTRVWLPQQTKPVEVLGACQPVYTSSHQPRCQEVMKWWKQRSCTDLSPYCVAWTVFCLKLVAPASCLSVGLAGIRPRSKQDGGRFNTVETQKPVGSPYLECSIPYPIWTTWVDPVFELIFELCPFRFILFVTRSLPVLEWSRRYKANWVHTWATHHRRHSLGWPRALEVSWWPLAHSAM